MLNLIIMFLLLGSNSEAETDSCPTFPNEVHKCRDSVTGEWHYDITIVKGEGEYRFDIEGSVTTHKIDGEWRSQGNGRSTRAYCEKKRLVVEKQGPRAPGVTQKFYYFDGNSISILATVEGKLRGSFKCASGLR